MPLFTYPKTQHRRTLAPSGLKRYQSYKRYLQHEFSRVCVYCRHADCTNPFEFFTVDHYRPKGDARFAALICDYENLYYCCHHCNSRKGSYWPLDEKKGPFVVVPCDHKMSDHLWFNNKTGEVEKRSTYGEFTIELLQLNEAPLVQWRKAAVLTLNLYESELAAAERTLKAGLPPTPRTHSLSTF